MLLLSFLLGQALGLPEVENPIPDKIGLGHIITVAGAGGMLGGLFQVCSTSAKRERAIAWGGVIGFCLAAGIYCLSLLVQLVSS
ncbi:MAG TPA: hypothetical protein VF255_02845 [Solirubrobacterales bacterium]